MLKSSKIFIAGHNGMVGSAIYRCLVRNGYKNIITANRKSLNLLDQKKTLNFLQKHDPDVLIIAAAKVGGILANNTYRAQFLYENIQIQNNLIHGGFLANVKKILFLGSSCIYPKKCPQPIKESYLLKSPLEYTNEPYAIAKIAGLKMIENYNLQYNNNKKYLCLMPCNLYGPNDNFDLNNSHFLPALIRKIYEAKIHKKKEVVLWGNGSPSRELLHVDDFANACIKFLKIKIDQDFINIGSGEEYTIKQYAQKIKKLIKYEGTIKFDKSKPNGVKRKLLDSTIAKKYGWKSNIKFDTGIKSVINEFKLSMNS